ICGGKGTIGTPATYPECKNNGEITQTSKRMKFNMQCPQCKKTNMAETTCPSCHGERVLDRNEPLEIRIKPETQNEQRIRLENKDNAERQNGPSDDLYIIVRIKQHSI